MNAPETAARRGRWTLVALGALFVLPVAIGWIAYLTGFVPGATSNYGTLLEPRPLVLAPLAPLRGRWVLVQFDSGACAQSCERKLYTMRQARRAQGVNAKRVERLWLITDATPPRAELLAAIEGTHVSRGNAAAAAEFPAGAVLADHIWVVDPLGNLMLRFPRDADPGRVVRDLERLLKVSGFG
jgi:hypothetical protein